MSIFKTLLPAWFTLSASLLLFASGCNDGSDKKTAPSAVEEDAPAPAENPLYFTDASFIRDKKGRAIFLRGINVSNSYKSNVETESDNIGERGYAHMATGGLNAVRLVTQWWGLEPEPGVYSEIYLDLVEQRIRWAAAQGLYVIIDMHQDVYGPGFNHNGMPEWTCDQSYYDSYEPTSPWYANYLSDEVAACFDQFYADPELHQHLYDSVAQLAERVRDVENVIGVDTLNEPHWGTRDPSDVAENYLYPFHRLFAESLAVSLPERLTFFEPVSTFNAIPQTFLPGPATEGASVFAPHYYNPSVEFDRHYDGDGNSVENAVEFAVEAGAELGVPVVYGEVGGDGSTDNMGDYLLDLYHYLDAHMVGAFIWDYSVGGGFAVIDRDTRDWKPYGWTFLRPAPSAVAGTPTAFAWDVATLKFTLNWIEDIDAGDTEIILPQLVKDAGFTLTVDGQSAEPVLNDLGTRLVIMGGVGGERSLELNVDAAYNDLIAQ